MSLDLDKRQRAMLAEMGVRVWWPQPEDPTPPSAAPTAAATAPGKVPPRLATAPGNAPQKPPPAPVQPVTVQPAPAATDNMDWSALEDAVSKCQACPMSQGRRAAVFTAPTHSAQADWFVVGDPPDEAQERTGAPFVDETGQLLDNMLKAVGVRRQHVNPATPGQTSAYLSLVLKCHPAMPTAPDTQMLQTCAQFLRREIALVQPKVIVAMGRQAMQLLLSEDHPQGPKLPLGKLRGQVWHYQGVPVVVTYPPAYLLRNGQDKARAWVDLCLAADVAQGKPSPRL